MRKTRSIRFELLITMLFITIILTLGIIVSMCLIVSKVYDQKINHENENLTNLISQNLTLFTDKAYKVAETLVCDPRIISMNGSEQTQVLKDILKQNDYFELLSIENSTGMQIAKSEGELGDRSDKWWFIQMKETKKPFISKSFYSITSGRPITSVFMPIFDGNKFVGMIGCDFSLNYLQQLVEEYSNEEDGRYCFIIDGEGAVIAHPENELVNQSYNYKTLTKSVISVDSNNNPLKDSNGNIKTETQSIQVADKFSQMIQNVMSGNSGSTKFEDIGENYYSSYAPIKLSGESDNWAVVTIQKESIAKSIINQIIKTTVISAIVILIIDIILILIIANKITHPIVEISKLLAKASTGDFTEKSKIKSNNELGLLVNNFNQMVQKISSLVDKAQRLSDNIKESSKILNNRIEKSKQATNEINIAINDISSGATNQAIDSEKSVQLEKGIAEKFSLLTEKSESVINEVNNSSTIIEDGFNKAEDLKEKTETTLEIMEKTQQSINNLNEKSKSIEVILKTLHDISKQTKMLSLNASIESSKAGEAGKGFAVVANQIGNLSDRSKQETDNITDILSDFQDEIKNSVDMMENIKTVSNEQFVSVSKVNSAFSKITSTVKEVENIINDVGEFIKLMDKDNTIIVDSISNMAAISEQTAACSEQVSASISEQAQSISEISNQTEELTKKVELLDLEISKFKI